MDRVTEILTCPICLQLFRDPRILPCQHTFCFSCINKQIELNPKTKFEGKCPVCRYLFPIQYTREALVDLPKNLLANQLIDVDCLNSSSLKIGKKNFKYYKPSKEAKNSKDTIAIDDFCSAKERPRKRCHLSKVFTGFIHPQDITFMDNAGEKLLLVTDVDQHCVKMFSFDSGSLIGQFQPATNRHSKAANAFCPSGIALVEGMSNQVVVTERQKNRARMIDVGTGTFLWSLEGTFDHPLGVECDTRHKLLYVCDEYNHRIKVYDYCGKWITDIHGVDSGDDKGFVFPRFVAADKSRDVVAVADCGNHRVQLLDIRNMRIVATIGREGSRPGEFQWPQGMAFGPSGTLVVADHQETACLNRLQVFSKDGRWVKVLGAEESAVMEFPLGVAVHENNEILVVDNAQNIIKAYSTKLNKE